MCDDQFLLQWSSYEGNFSAYLKDLRASNDFFDVTLACEDDQVHCHKLVLSSCSSLLLKLFRQNVHPHPLLYLKGIQFKHLLSVLDFMYEGQVNVAQEDLACFMATAEELKVKGLTQTSDNECQEAGSPVQVKRCVKEKQTQLLQQDLKNSPTHLDEFVFSPEGTVTPRQSSSVPGNLKIQDSESILLAHNKFFPQNPFSVPNLENILSTAKYGDSNHLKLPPSYSFIIGGDQENNLAGIDPGKVGLPFANKNVKKETCKSLIQKKRDGLYHCLICQFKSEKRNYVRRHVARHIPSSRVFCDVCNRSFKNSDSLRCHKYINHKAPKLKETIDDKKVDTISNETSDLVGKRPTSGENSPREITAMKIKEGVKAWENNDGSREENGVNAIEGIVELHEKEECLTVEGTFGLKGTKGTMEEENKSEELKDSGRTEAWDLIF